MSAIVPVAAAVIIRGDGHVLLAQRPSGKPYAGYWEFPGGKIEPGENPERALIRELREELGLIVTRTYPWLTQQFTYPHAHVELNFLRVFAWEGEPHGHEGQAFAWQRPGAFTVCPLLPANKRILRALELPDIYAITMASDLGLAQFLRRAEVALNAGVRLIQLREKEWAKSERDRLAHALQGLAQRYGAKVLLNGEAEEARELGLSGVHVTSARLRAATARPADLMCAASCHDRAELDLAAALDLDFAILGPIAPTPTHPNATALGWERFGQLIRHLPIPVYALGGLQADDLACALEAGAQGIAMRRGAWVAQDRGKSEREA